MAFDIGNGLASAGAAVADTAGKYTLEAQKAELENGKITLADQLAGKRESAGRQEQGLINAAAADKLQTFQGGENEKNRASEEKRTGISASATLGAAATAAAAAVQGHTIAADASRDVAEITGRAHVTASENYAKSRLEVADTNNKTKKDIATDKAATGLTPNALDAAAVVYNTTGVMPSYGMGGAQTKTAIQNRAAEMRTESGKTTEDWMTGTAGAAAAKPALAHIMSQSTMANAFSATAEKNGELVKSLLDKGAGPTGVPVLNRWLQAGRKNVEGDADVSALNAAMETFKQEQAKIMSGATGAAGITDAARSHVDEMISTASTPEQIKKVMEVFALERQNRVASYDEQIKSLQARMSGGNPTVQPAPAATMPAPTTAPRPIPLNGEGKADIRLLVPGIVYSGPNGSGRWNGTTMEPVR